MAAEAGGTRGEASILPGVVYLVGAGPGDPGLITARGLRRLQAADVVVYDRLVDERVLAEARPGAELIFVGKATSHHTMPQAEISAILIAKARAGKFVVRLKGGDPFVFGRGGEEAEELVKAGVRFEIVPGITSAVAAPAYAGIPVTHGDCAASFTVVTGHEDPTKPESRLDWPNLGAGNGTLVFLMGVSRLVEIARQLLRHGRPADTPVALVRWGTWAKQETLVGSLANIAERARDHGFGPPAVLVVGEVVRLRERLRWFDNRPLFGKRVLVTRTREQASDLSQLLRGLGAEPVEVPVIRVEPPQSWQALDSAIARLGTFDWVVFTSANGVQSFFERLAELGHDVRAFGEARVAVIGPATAATLSRKGIRADLVPDEYVAEAVVESLLSSGAARGRVLVARAAEARAVLVSLLREQGATVEEVAVYRTLPTPESGLRLRELIASQRLDVVTFASSSTVRNTLNALGEGAVELINSLVVACIGPITARAAGELGLRVDVVAEQYTIPGLVQALEDFFTVGGNLNARFSCDPAPPPATQRGPAPACARDDGGAGRPHLPLCRPRPRRPSRDCRDAG
ncbi:MAG: uroporphyrinogen-III C-methyltransferase [Chloroflexota bacterium]